MQSWIFYIDRATKEPKETPSKIKALNETILRMNEKNVRLTTENKSLKEDLDKLLAHVAETKEKKRKLLIFLTSSIQFKVEFFVKDFGGDGT